MQLRRKLIEVALPLDAINKASAREKSIRHGHPSTLHLWWARRPLAAARAVIFGQMVDDPSEYVDVLLSDPETRRAAQRVLMQRRAAGGAPPGLNEAADQPVPALREIAAEQERERLFGILRDLVRWENTANETVLERARAEIRASWRRTCEQNADHPRAGELFDPETLPAFHDPFAGGGSLPLEAQRLGLEAHASDLNPVAVLINKAMIEVPPRFAGRAPVHPESRGEASLVEREWRGAAGLAEDVRRYGQWMRDEAERRIGHLYPQVEITPRMVRERPDLAAYEGRKLTVIAWLWARTVRSPNPAFADVEMPLCSSFMLSTKKGKEAYVEPVIEGRGYRFEVKAGPPADEVAAKSGTSAGKRRAFRCLMSGVPLPYQHIRTEGKARRLDSRLMAVVAKGDRRRVYLSPSPEHEAIACEARPTWKPDCEMPKKHRNFQGPVYGLDNLGDLFTPRQLVALTTFSDLVGEATARIRRDAEAACSTVSAATSRNETAARSVQARHRQMARPGSRKGLHGVQDAAEAGLPDDDHALPDDHSLPDDDRPLRDGGTGAAAYAEAVSLYLALNVSRLANRQSSLCFWDSSGQNVQQVFARQALPMVWDPCEGNPFSNSSGNWLGQLKFPVKFILATPQTVAGRAEQSDVRRSGPGGALIVSTDPPYYDNIGYADLSDFFYVWLRRSLKPLLPDMFATLAVPKAEELVATPYRHGGKEAAEAFFLNGMTQAFQRLAGQTHPAFPVTIYYAFKQSGTKGAAGRSSTGWETFLDAVIGSGFAITGTWPMRTEQPGALKKRVAALASSIILVCHRRPADAPAATRRDFLLALRSELPRALRLLQSGNIAPVDLDQAAIGPGMAVYTRHEKVVDAEGKQMSVREALALINQILDETLTEQEGDFDAESRWALRWFKQHGFDEGGYGVADVLFKAKNTSVEGMVEAGILASKGGKVRLLTPEELSDDWDPAVDSRMTAWETVHHLLRVHDERGETGAAEIVAALGGRAETARELCYQLYTVCDRKKRAAEALRYNTLVQSWSEIARLARTARAEQTGLFADAP